MVLREIAENAGQLIDAIDISDGYKNRRRLRLEELSEGPWRAPLIERQTGLATAKGISR